MALAALVFTQRLEHGGQVHDVSQDGVSIAALLVGCQHVLHHVECFVVPTLVPPQQSQAPQRLAFADRVLYSLGDLERFCERCFCGNIIAQQDVHVTQAEIGFSERGTIAQRFEERDQSVDDLELPASQARAFEQPLFPQQ